MRRLVAYLRERTAARIRIVRLLPAAGRGMLGTGLGIYAELFALQAAAYG